MAVKNNVDVSYFATIVPTHVYFAEDGQMEKKVFLATWKDIPAQNEIQFTIEGTNCNSGNYRFFIDISCYVSQNSEVVRKVDDRKCIFKECIKVSSNPCLVVKQQRRCLQFQNINYRTSLNRIHRNFFWYHFYWLWLYWKKGGKEEGFGTRGNHLLTMLSFWKKCNYIIRSVISPPHNLSS